MDKGLIVKIVVVFILIIGCRWFIDKNKDDKIKAGLQKILTTSLSKNEKISFRFDTLTNFDWDEIVICPPYFQPRRFEDKNHIEFTEVEETGIQSADHFSVIAFLKNRKIVNVVKISPFMQFEGFPDGNLIARKKMFQAAPSLVDQKTHVIVTLIN